MYSKRADDAAVLREQRPFREPLLDGLGHAEVDDLGHRLAIVARHQHVGRLDIAMDDALLMSVLNGLTNRHEQFQALRGLSTGCHRSTW